jgi:hypothetical protein
MLRSHRFIVAVSLLAGCAQAGPGRPDGGRRDLSVPPPDLYGADLFGVDQSMPPPDFAGLDLYGVDLSTAGGDMAFNRDLMPAVCSVVPQSGCTYGNKCTYDVSNNTTCIANGANTPGQLCGPSTDDCVAGSICINETGTTVDQCRAFCTVDTDCTQPPVSGAPSAMCLYMLTGTPSSLCSIPCNPVTKVGASGCAAGLGCQVFGVTSGSMTLQKTDCGQVAATGGGDGADCTTNGDADCKAGFTCVTVGSGATAMHHCREVCRVNTNTDCSNGAYSCNTPSGGGTPTYGFCCSTTTGC